MTAKKVIALNKKIKIIFLLALIAKPNVLFATTHCTITALPVSFGTYNAFSPMPDNTTSTVILVCNGDNSAYQIALNTGISGSYTPRKMFHGISSWLNYNLYTSAAYTTIWGNGTSGTGVVTGLSKNCKINSPCNHVVYAQIPAGQTAPPAGNYIDTIVVTVNY